MTTSKRTQVGTWRLMGLGNYLQLALKRPLRIGLADAMPLRGHQYK